jgi:hypothetical protein
MTKKIKFADATAIDALEPYVHEVLDALARNFECPGMARAFVSDESKVWDFMPESYFNEDRKVDLLTDLELRLEQTVDEKKLRILNYRISRVRKIPDRFAALRRLASVSAQLGIDVAVDDHIYEAAIRLRDKS